MRNETVNRLKIMTETSKSDRQTVACRSFVERAACRKTSGEPKLAEQ